MFQRAIALRRRRSACRPSGLEQPSDVSVRLINRMPERLAPQLLEPQVTGFLLPRKLLRELAAPDVIQRSPHALLKQLMIAGCSEAAGEHAVLRCRRVKPH